MKNKLAWQIEIPRRNRQCSLGGETFIPGMEYYSIISPSTSEEMQRQDFCLACWQLNTADSKTLGQWKATVPSAQVEEEDLIAKNRDEQALDLLKKLHISDAAEDLADAFVLALYLARRRLVYLRQQLRQKQDEVMLYEIAATEEILPIKRIPLSQLQVTLTQQRLADKMRT